jgi:hypothetical protein
VLAVVLPEVPVIVTVVPPMAAVLLAVSVSTLELPEDVGLNEAVTPLAKPVAANDTLPVKLPRSFTVMVSVALLPWVTGRVVADGFSVKPVPGMVRARVAELTSAPSVPVNKTLYVPAGVLVWEVKFTVTLPLALSEEGEKLAWTPREDRLHSRKRCP